VEVCEGGNGLPNHGKKKKTPSDLYKRSLSHERYSYNFFDSYFVFRIGGSSIFLIVVFRGGAKGILAYAAEYPRF
jgi:hypothetical protein